jgi:hypothetical protein
MKKQNEIESKTKHQKPNFNQTEIKHLREFKNWLHHSGL